MSLRVFFILVLVLLPFRAGAQEGLTLFAAASLTDVLQPLQHRWQTEGNPPLRISLAGTSTLARQIEAGAPADILLSADQAWIDYLLERNLIDPSSVINPIGNHLSLIAPAASGTVPDDPFLLLTDLIHSGDRLAVADPAHVPAGRYAQAALENLGLWPAMSLILARTDNVRATLALVGRGEAPLGIVYATDVAISPDVKEVYRFPEESHPVIRYPFAVTVDSDQPESAAAFLEWLTQPSQKAVFHEFGFGVED